MRVKYIEQTPPFLDQYQEGTLEFENLVNETEKKGASPV